MKKQCYVFIDDVIFLFRDLTKERPASLFDHPFLQIFKEAHDRYGTKTQLNVFYQIDDFYGEEEPFTLADMTDAYRAEWEASADWLKLAFHAHSEFPDYPYINTGYGRMKRDFEQVRREILRFAGERSFATATNPHWLPISLDGCRALYDCGVRMLGASFGERYPDTEAVIGQLPYSHDARLLQGRRPEVGIFFRNTLDTKINYSLCGHNHVSDMPEGAELRLAFRRDEQTGLLLRRFCTGKLVVDHFKSVEQAEAAIRSHLDDAYLSFATHEQYCYPFYYNYQPDYGKKILAMAKIASEAGYTPIFLDEVTEYELV